MNGGIRIAKNGGHEFDSQEAHLQTQVSAKCNDVN